ncbi:VWA domain-containing protein, partial [Salmonella sp. s54836]|uniref:VWA domain-containing protein n=1 Tax=Salmonella sp. s54836 TaxID=3159673 RepID=UPI00397EE546
VTEYPEYDPKIKHTIWVDVNLAAPIFEEDDNKRALVDIVAVIDRSGSMSGEKLKLVKTTLEFVVSQLTAKDRLCLVVYDDVVDIVFPLTYVTSGNKTDIMSKIQSVQTRGTTNLCGGLLKG